MNYEAKAAYKRAARAVARKRSADRLGRASLATFYAPLTPRESMHDYVRSIDVAR